MKLKNMMRTCKITTCNAVLELNSENFYKNGLKKRLAESGEVQYFYRPECIECSKRIAAERRPARSLLDEPVAPPGTQCEICDAAPPNGVVHFDHALGYHRGWLCPAHNQFACRNTVTIDELERTINYLLSHEKKYGAAAAVEKNEPGIEVNNGGAGATAG